MEEESPLRGGTVLSKPPSTAPAFFVILHPSQGDGSKEEGILVANRDVSSVAPVITTGHEKSKSDFFLSANCTSGDITVTLDNNNMWNEFYRCNTEMVLTKQGRRMFPYCRYWISGLDPYLKYILVMDITPLDNLRYKWNGKWWEPAGKSDPHVLGRVFIHPESPSTGQYWMHQPVSFYKLKLTNNILDQEGHIILHSMHRYLPRLHVVPAEKASEVIQLNGPDVHTFTFPQTEFIAVTAYQNFQITQLKIDCNPFAKGFREGTVTGRPFKDLKHKPSDQELDSSESKNIDENEDPDRMQKIQELLRMSEYLDGDKENETFRSVQDFLKFTKTASELNKKSKQNEEVTKRSDEHSSEASQPETTEQPSVKIKQEPEDDYDYSKPPTIEGVDIKQEQVDAEVTDDYSNSDIDYPILEKHFAKFKEEPYLDGVPSGESPTGAAKASFITFDQGHMYLESAPDESNLEAPVIKSEDTLQDTEMHDSSLCTQSLPIFPISSINSHIGDDAPVKERRKRISKSKIDEIYVTLQTAMRTSRGPKRKHPKPSVTPTPGNEGTGAPIAKKRGRPPKPKFSKVGRPAKKDNPIEAPRLFPDFNPDLEDVDGVLFVAFSSKEALDIHTEKKPTDDVSSSSIPEVTTELTEEMQKILGLERQLLNHLMTMKYRQVIHPALQQVGLKLNIVDPSMSIDLRYLGVELPLPYITSNIKCEDNGLCAQVSGLPFVSRTGKTTDYTKIKGWRDKFSTESATPSIKIEGGRSESSVKNLSAFCSDELDEYLENEAKLMGDLKELTHNEPEPSLSYEFPTKSSSYVRTLDSVLKKQAQQAVPSVIPPEPRKKRKYTRRAITPRTNAKLKAILPAPLKDTSPKPYCAEKKEHSAPHLMHKIISSSVKSFTKSQSAVKPAERSGTSVEDNLFRSFQQMQTLSQQIVAKSIGFSKAQTKMMELEESAVWDGKPRTYITEERAELSLATLLTAQASLKNKPILKLMNKRTNSCTNEYCRLGCICLSLSATKPTVIHCGHVDCMFTSDCLKKESTSDGDGINVKASRTTKDEAETDLTPSFGWLYGYKPLHTGHGAASLEEHQEGNDCKSKLRVPIHFPIWNRSDIADDPEPLCIPEQAEFVEQRVFHKVHAEKGRSLMGGKLGRPSAVAQTHQHDSSYMHVDSMMTCARVRPFQQKTQEENKVKEQSMCDTPVQDHDLGVSKDTEQEKETSEDDENLNKRCKMEENSSSTKLIEIISDCEDKDSKALNITSQQSTIRNPQSFKLGSFDIQLLQESKNEEKSTSGTSCSRVKIAVSAEKQHNSTPPKPGKVRLESGKPPDDENEPYRKVKSHGGKGLPFYTKVTPAGKLVARLKTSDVSDAELVEVNGKNRPKAKLLLGQMGALHPANRHAAYITHRLQSSLFKLAKEKEAGVKIADKSSSSDSLTEEKSKDVLPSQQNKTAAQSITQFVMGEVGSMQKISGVGSSEPSLPGSPKPRTQSTQLILVSSSATAVTTTTSSPMNVASLSTTSLSSADLSTVSPSKSKPTPSLPTLMRVTKVITKGSSLSIPAGLVASSDANAVSLTSVPSSKDTNLTPPKLSPAVVRPAAAGNASSIPISNNPAVNKPLATSLPSLIVSPNVSRIGSVPSQVGLKIASPMTVKTVPAPTAGVQKRLGPRLLLIPVNNAASPTVSRPVQCVQSSPGQKMVLQPIKNTSGVTLFRHPNGQIIQLLPLQQVNSASIQPRRQQVVVRNPGPVMGVRLPVLTKPDTGAPTSTSKTATSVTLTALPKLTAVSPSKASTNPSGVTFLPQNPPMLTQVDALATKATSPISNCEASSSVPQIVSYTASGHGVITTNTMPRQIGGLTMANVPGPSLQNVTITNAKPGTGNDSSKDKMSLLTSQPSVARVETNDKKAVKECVGQPTSEIVKNEDEAKREKSVKQVKSVTQEVKEEQRHSGQQDNEQSQLSVDSIDDSLDSDVDVISETGNAHGLLTASSPADKGDNQQSPADENANSQGKIGVSSPGTSEQVSPEVKRKMLCTGERLMEQRSAKSEVSESSSDQNNSENVQEDPCIKQNIFDNMDTSQHNLLSEDDSDFDESVDIETVEEVSERLSIEHLKASASSVTLNKKSSKGRKKGSVDIVEDTFSSVGEEEGNIYHRKNHTANERKRRSELRDLFEELKNALGLHNLPKVSKSYILKQAIEEIEGLTDSSDTLTKKKTALSQTQTQLIKKVSNLSGKPKEVVQKKLEYLYAKQKAMEAGVKKALQKTSPNLPLQNKESLNSLTPEVETIETLNSPNKKPIILSRKAMLFSKEGMHQQPSVSLPNPNLLLAQTVQVGKPENILERQSAAVPPSLIRADLSPAQIKSGMTSVVIQLPGTISLQGIIGNSPVPISLSTVPTNISTVAPSAPVSEKDDLSMMPKIVNVTSLAQDAKVDLAIGIPDTEECKSIPRSGSSDTTSAPGACTVTAESSILSTSVPMDKAKEGLISPVRKSCSLISNLLQSVPQENDTSNSEPPLKSKIDSISSTSPGKLVNDVRDSGLDLELKKLTAAIDEAGLDPSELSDTVADPEDADETLTSLLNEIAFLNQQLNDPEDLDFPGSDTASRSSVSKLVDGDSSPFSFGRFKEVSEPKEKNLSFSPLFMRLEEGEIRDSVKHDDETSIMVFEGGARKDPPVTDVVGAQTFPYQPLTTLTPQRTDKQGSSSSDVFWKPMPKLAPLGLKAQTITNDQRVLASKPMPSLAPVAMILSSPKTKD